MIIPTGFAGAVRQAARAAGAIAVLVVARRLLTFGQTLTSELKDKKRQHERVDAESDDSFPASDPPSWSPTTVNQSPAAPV